MNRRSLLLILAVFMLAVAPIAVSAKRLSEARQRLSAVETLHSATLRDAQEILDLRARHQVVNAAERPAQDVIALVNAVLADAGIPANRLKSLVPESDSAPTQGRSESHGPKYRRQSVRLVLENIAPLELGAFLTHWSDHQQVWTPVRIELNHVRSTNPQHHNRYDVTIVLSAIYVASS